MAETLYTRALIRAAEIQGSTQALASLLRVPENTLLRWMAGRAQMPVQAFLRVIEIISEYERREAPAAEPAAGTRRLHFVVGRHEARCARCDGVEFVKSDPQLPLRYVSELVCCGCGQRVVHGELIARLAQDAAFHSKTVATAREKRHAKLLKSAPPKTPAPPPEKSEG